MSNKNMEKGVSAHEGVSSVLGERVGDIGRRVIGVTGAPGAWTNQIAKRLEAQNFSVLWPEQKFTNAGDEHTYNANCENPEVNRINDDVLSSCGMSRFSGKSPVFYDVPFPGPREVIGKFPADQNIVIVDCALCLLWGLWEPYITDLIIVDASAEVITKFIQKWIDGNMNTAECRQLRDFYYDNLEEKIATVDSVYRVDNSMLTSGGQENSWVFHQIGLNDIMNEFLNSGIEATDG